MLHGPGSGRGQSLCTSESEGRATVCWCPWGGGGVTVHSLLPLEAWAWKQSFQMLVLGVTAHLSSSA